MTSVSITSFYGETLLTVWLNVSFVGHNRHHHDCQLLFLLATKNLQPLYKKCLCWGSNLCLVYVLHDIVLSLLVVCCTKLNYCYSNICNCQDLSPHYEIENCTKKISFYYIFLLGCPYMYRYRKYTPFNNPRRIFGKLRHPQSRLASHDLWCGWCARLMIP